LEKSWLKVHEVQEASFEISVLGIDALKAF
jgi:hypothetical protein